MTKSVNHATKLRRSTVGGSIVTTIVTELPSKPQLLTACRNPQNAKTRVKRDGTLVYHGVKLWMPYVDCIEAPTVCDDHHAVFVQPPCCGPGQACNWFMAEPSATPPTVHWSTLVHPCTDTDPADAYFLGHNPGAVMLGDGPYQTIPYVQQESVGGLIWDGSRCFLPDHGSVSVSGSGHFNFFSGPLSGSIRATTNIPSSEPAISDPSALDSRPCASTIALGERQKIPGAGYFAVVQGRATGGAIFFQINAPGFIFVEWWRS